MARHVATISALAAAGGQLYVGHRQSEAALKAATAALINAATRRPAYGGGVSAGWIDKAIDALCPYNTILMSIGDDHSLSPDGHWKLTALWTRLAPL